MGIVKSIFSRKRSKQEEAEPAAAAIMSCEPAVTKLMMLMPDASGIAAYQLHTFVTARQAEDYLGSVLRGDIQEGTIMFWGLTWTPSDNGNQDVEAEPVVLIRDAKRPGLVYTFSFTDIDSAHDFVRHEVKAGLDLAQTAIFWAAPAEATVDHWGQITVTPSRLPAREPAPNGGAPEPLVAPEHDESNRTELHIDETSPVRLPEFVSDEPDAAHEPEAVSEPARKAVDDADISKVINILEARGLRAPSSPPQPNDEPEGVEDTADEPSDAGNGVAHVGDEAMHIDLSDVFGRGRDPETLTTIEDFRSHEGRETNGLDATDESLIEALYEPVSGIVAAWSNIGFAIDEAIDAYVARRVSATISWRRLTRSLAAAARFRMFVTWRIISRALAAGAAIQAERESAIAEAWRNAARAIYQVAESKSGRRAMRLAWANISWTLEEAIYAARLQQKKASARVWFNAAGALAGAARKKDSMQRGLRTAWRRLAVEALDAANAQELHRARAVFAWTSIAKSLTDAVEAMYRHERIVFAWDSTGIALNEYIAAKLQHDGLVAAWTRLAAAIEEAAEATARHNGIIRAWRLLAIETLIAADLQVKREAAINAWTNASEALFAGAAAKIRLDGLVAVWRAASNALHDFADAQMRRNGMISAWHSLACALADGARANLKLKNLIQAWRNVANACRSAARAHVARQKSRRKSWARLTTAFADVGVASRRRDAAIVAWDAIAIALGGAIAAKIYHDRCVAIWNALAIAIADALPLRRRELGAIKTWHNAMLALSEAAVAEAQVRIAEAGLNNRRMKRVNAAILKAKGREAASVASEAAEQAVKVARGAIAGPRRAQKRTRRQSQPKGA